MGVTRCVALLRGINVGGRNKVPMADLREAFTDQGFTSVGTYIQSGNVLFETESTRGLEQDIEVMLERRFGFPLLVVVRSHRQLRNVVDRAPAGFGDRPDEYLSDSIFLKAPLTSAKALRVVQLRDGVDQVWPGTGLLYFARLAARNTQSKMSSFVGTPEYQQMTIRSWTTTCKLLARLDAMDG